MLLFMDQTITRVRRFYEPTLKAGSEFAFNLVFEGTTGRIGLLWLPKKARPWLGGGRGQSVCAAVRRDATECDSGAGGDFQFGTDMQRNFR